MEKITVKGINKAYNGVKVLEDFSVGFEYGKCTAVMGASGCGKTTLLNILMGTDRDCTGSVEGMPERFAVVFQEDRLCEQFSVLDNIRMVIAGAHRKVAGETVSITDTTVDRDRSGKPLYSTEAGEEIKKHTGEVKKTGGYHTAGRQDTESEIMEVLKELGIAEHAHSRVSELSGGQKRRTAIARALMYDAELLVMDEPFKGLDEDSRNAAVKAIKRRKSTVIMVTHDPEEAGLMEAELVYMTKKE